MSNTKIICTVGPSSRKADIIKQMILSGMSIARFNMSHDNRDIHREAVLLVRDAAESIKSPIKIMIDIRGPEARLGAFGGGEAMLSSGQYFTLTTRRVLGNSDIACVQLPTVPPLFAGDKILLSDGIVELSVINTTSTDILCRVISGGRVADHKGINFPGTPLGLPYLSDLDKDDLLFAVSVRADMVALSFVSTASDVSSARTFLDNNGGTRIKLISKIENQLGVDNLDEIIKISDGIMIARGDLGAEIPLERLPHVQKDIICRCLQEEKFVITATEMLESMIEKSRPTRAEATDVANAVYDGTDAVMLSAETASGRHPVKAVEYMYKIVDMTEQFILR